MSLFEHVALLFCTVVCSFYLAAGGYVAIRSWLKARAAAKAEAFAAKVKAAISE